MNGAKGDALEWALALLRAPAERHALRNKPLPTGIHRLLGIAAGAMPADLAEAARTFNESESRIREAAQFYAREILFFPQADAYRVLGVAADASDAQLKTHHRLLQHWLHPDRLNNEDDAVFAARVNVAWNRVRNAERRNAYDDLLRQEDEQGASEAAEGVRGLQPWMPAAEMDAGGWRHRVPVLVLSVSCVFLALLVLRDLDRKPAAWEEAAATQSPAPASDDALAALTRPPTAPRAASVTRRAVERTPAPAVLSSAKPPPPAPVPASVPVPVPPVDAPLAPVPAMPGKILAATTTSQPVQAPVTLAVSRKPISTAAVVPRPAPLPSPPDDFPSSERSRAPLPEPAPSQDARAMPSPARIQQAWAAGDQLLRYLAVVGRPSPPIWSSPAIQSSADQLRRDMHGSQRVNPSGRQWQIGNRSAVLTSAYVVRGEAGGTGRLTADLVWREDRWLVTGLSMERAD